MSHDENNDIRFDGLTDSGSHQTHTASSEFQDVEKEFAAWFSGNGVSKRREHLSCVEEKICERRMVSSFRG